MRVQVYFKHMKSSQALDLAWTEDDETVALLRLTGETLDAYLQAHLLSQNTQQSSREHK